MKAVIFILLFSLGVSAGDSLPAEALQPAPITSTACVHDDKAFRCVKYIRNYDADTITFDIPGVPAIIGKNISIRVRHVDTPEIRGTLPCEKETARIAKRLIENKLKLAKRIDLADIDRDKYFRILADVIVDGEDLGKILIKNQLAYAYEGKTKEKMNWCMRSPAALVQ